MFSLQPPADQLKTILDGIAEDHLDDPTPCPGRSVAGLISHVHGLAIAFRDAAGKVVGPTTTTPPSDDLPPLDPDWRRTVPEALDALATAWQAPAAWQGETVAGGVEMPGEVTGAVASNELVIHGWDLAVATGQPFAAAEANLAASYAFCSQTPDDPESRQGLFGPVVRVPEGAPLLDRTLGYAGRDPRWRAPG